MQKKKEVFEAGECAVNAKITVNKKAVKCTGAAKVKAPRPKAAPRPRKNATKVDASVAAGKKGDKPVDAKAAKTVAKAKATKAATSVVAVEAAKTSNDGLETAKVLLLLPINLINFVSFKEIATKCLPWLLREGWVLIVDVAAKITSNDVGEDAMLKAGALKATLDKVDKLCNDLVSQAASP